MRLAILPILVLCTLSVSCSDSSPAPPPAPQKTVIDAQLKALNKAKAVQDTVDQQKKDMDKQVQDAGG